MKKNKTAKNFTNFKMNGDVYKLRRQVLNIIYEVKNMGLNIPWIDVRIGEDKNCQILGKAKLKGNIIWITPQAINEGENHLRHVVLHELIHTIFGINHNEKCHLMKSVQPKIIQGKDKLLQLFKNYYIKFNNITESKVA